MRIFASDRGQCVHPFYEEGRRTGLGLSEDRGKSPGRSVRIGSALAALALLLCLCGAAPADTIAFYASQEFSGGASPVGPAPWLGIIFQDAGPGTVTMTMTARGLTGSEFVSGLYFNLAPSIAPEALTLANPTCVGAFATPTVSLGSNAFKADGDGYFDVLVGFATSGGEANRFTAGDSISYTITGPANLSAASFDYLSEHGGGAGQYPVAWHVQAISGGLSGWVSVPEPATLAMLLAGAAGLAWRRSVKS